MKKYICLLGIVFVVSGCSLPAAPAGPADPAASPAGQPVGMESVSHTFTATSEPAPTATHTPAPTPTPTSILVHQGPGEMVIPILLYHHIAISPKNSRYYVPPEKFEEQMKLLHDWGYTTIGTQLLAQAILQGADLPERPVVITFDDGNLDNYYNAFPIMQKYGFTGTLYIVGNYVGVDPFMNVDQIKEMAAAGWEIGSHGMRHLDLNALETEQKRYEIVRSRENLEERLGVPVVSFSYPFGLWSPGAVDFARLAGYSSAVSTDNYSFRQSKYNVYSLERREIVSSADLATFINYLPWQGELE